MEVERGACATQVSPPDADVFFMSLARLQWILPGIYVAWLVLDYEFHFLDFVNLAFHEAGHIFLHPFGTTIGMLGGTLGQLFFPVACGVHFLRLGQTSAALICGIWLSESLMNVARYMADAREMALPLVGGEIHDWNWMLGRLGWLDAASELATALHWLASLMAIGCVVLLAKAPSGEGLTPTNQPAPPQRSFVHR